MKSLWARVPASALLIGGLLAIVALIIVTQSRYCLSLTSSAVGIQLQPAPPHSPNEIAGH